ncbi:MAG: proline--tRNA ligase, partial [Campylobacterota bacterium]|nr:proline--tRNA ligase [Campylobacterota bacterium]
MKFSNSFIPTTKETPSDATLPSHQFLIRAGFINQQGSGLYNYLPLGKIVLDKIRNIVKEELDNAGCNEVQLGFVTPIDLWERSGRADDMGQEMLRIRDRKNNEFVLSPTNEEAMVELVKNRITSYRDLPVNLYQINTKFRDEARPRFGLMRGREFLMKDGYSFHSSKEDMVREFNLMEETYKKIYTRLGLDFRVVEADSGAIGGTGSKEFHIIANSGEDTIVICDSCDYGANIETLEEINEDEFNDLTYEELQSKQINEKCKCGGGLSYKKGIEAGHIFQLGTKYSEALEANFLNENGKTQPFEMATFGIGVSRLVASVIEQSHDDKGCIWTKETAPYLVDIIVSNAKKDDELNAGLKIYEDLKLAGIETIIDDRKKERFGFKMGDFELIGFPYAIVVGKKLKDGMVELIKRETGEKVDLELDNVVSYI